MSALARYLERSVFLVPGLSAADLSRASGAREDAVRRCLGRLERAGAVGRVRIRRIDRYVPPQVLEARHV